MCRTWTDSQLPEMVRGWCGVERAGPTAEMRGRERARKGSPPDRQARARPHWRVRAQAPMATQRRSLLRGDSPARAEGVSQGPRYAVCSANLGLRFFVSWRTQGLGVHCEDGPALHLPRRGPWAAGAKEAVTHSPILRAATPPIYTVRCEIDLPSPSGARGA